MQALQRKIFVAHPYKRLCCQALSFTHTHPVLQNRRSHRLLEPGVATRAQRGPQGPTSQSAQRTRPRIPNAPPTFDDVPPPPPPPPMTSQGGKGPSRRTLLAILLGGGFLWWYFINRQIPSIYRDPDGLNYVKTKAGNWAMVNYDGSGRMYMIDEAGTLYYDTGEPAMGIYIVDLQGDMYNLFMDRDGEPNQVRVGNVADLASINVKDIGGIPTQSLAEAVGARDAGMSGGKMMVFPDFPRKNATPDELQKYLMPPDAPAFPSKDGARPPPILEEGEIQLQRKRRLWPFGGDSKGSGGEFQRGVEGPFQ
ncbi:hypothetical protein WJX84_000029 [Apatococcus fuscideae]|uniref:Uncharacterized protein n=1 Tax=Apatococcus fuscideae TaxID=2026836 RepID=A0AAW1TIV1_9CHLO